MTVYLLEDPIFQRHSGMMYTCSSAHTDSRLQILTLNLAARRREVGFGPCWINGWEGDMVNEPIHLPLVLPGTHKRKSKHFLSSMH